MAEQDLIMEAMDHPEWEHRLLRALMKKELRFIEESLTGAQFDLIETGGGAGSDTVISPKLHAEFCLPYDREMYRAVQALGLKTTYHTCGGMMHILELIKQNETDASETLAPPGVGSNITEPSKVHRLSEGFGKNGGYILSASDHFFETAVANLQTFAPPRARAGIERKSEYEQGQEIAALWQRPRRSRREGCGIQETPRSRLAGCAEDDQSLSYPELFHLPEEAG